MTNTNRDFLFDLSEDTLAALVSEGQIEYQSKDIVTDILIEYLYRAYKHGRELGWVDYQEQENLDLDWRPL